MLYYIYSLIKTGCREGKVENTLKIKIKIKCDLCGCSLNRTKSIKVFADNKIDAIEEAKEKIEQYKKSLVGKNCKICQLVLNEEKQEAQE